MATATQINNFIKRLGKLAVAESQRRIANGQGFVLPSVCIAQSALETGWGTSGLMTRANAYFGIKAGGSWKGAVYTAGTWEVANGEAYNTTANFRSYSSVADSVTDYYDLIGNSSRYSNALSFGNIRSNWKSPRACIQAIWAGGYATDTLYVEKIMSTITARNLAKYDEMILAEGLINGNYTLDHFTFSKSDFVKGTLVVTDSGRSIQNDRAWTRSLAIEWDKAPTSVGVFHVTWTFPRLIEGFRIFIAKLEGDTATRGIEVTYSNTLNLPTSAKFGVYIESSKEITPDMLSDDFMVTVSNINNPDTEEQYGTTLAHFVKV